jgi:hypothetical protein
MARSLSPQYFRGSSGLVGLAKGGFERRKVEEFYLEMTQVLGNKTPYVATVAGCSRGLVGCNRRNLRP